MLKTERFVVFTKDDLVFTKQEIECLGEEKEIELTREQINTLHEMTGGWAMYLSALLSCEKINAVWEGKPNTLLKYLETRVWELWDTEIKNLLMRLCIPTEISPQLAERLTGHPDGRGILEHFAKKENAFLANVTGETYRFHDIFRDFLISHAQRSLDNIEIRRLNDIAAEWYYEHGEYFAAARHYIQNKDHNGINRCMSATNRFHEEAGSLSVEVAHNFTKQYVMNLMPEFIAENPYLISKCAVVCFRDGDAASFIKYVDMLYERINEITKEYPDLAETIMFVGGLDFRRPMREYQNLINRQIKALTPKTDVPEYKARAATITQNLPYFHRSMREHSEYSTLNENDMRIYKESGGLMIGRDYKVMEESFIAGMYYERSELLNAVSHALKGYHAYDDKMQSETFLSANMMLSAILYAMGAAKDANRIMEQTEAFIEQKAPFLRPNFKALKTERAIRAGDTDAAREWLEVYASHSERLPFYQLCRHFTTLRSYIAVSDYEMAVRFGYRLHKLAVEYNRPLDQIEAGILISVALWSTGDTKKAVRSLEQAINTAIPFEFTQLFINEGEALLPLLWEVRERTGKTAAFVRFVGKLINEIYADHEFEPVNGNPPRFTEKQCTVLACLAKEMSYSDIGDAMGIGHGTVKSYVLRVYKRLGVHNARDAIVKAKMLGLLEQR